jgi:sulfite reductase (NADPH) hemoprotein beta-component
MVGGGLGRTPFIGKTIKPFLPKRDLSELCRGDPARLQPVSAGATTSTRRASRSWCTSSARRSSAPRSRGMAAIKDGALALDPAVIAESRRASAIRI